MTNDVRYAGLAVRFIALAVDSLLFFVVFIPVTRIVKGVWLMSANDHRWVHGWIITDPICLVFLAIMLAYFVFLEGLAGATMGKWLSGIRVVRLDRGEPGLARGLARNLLRVVDGLPALNIVGIVLILRSPERARCGDRCAGTRVIHAAKR